MITTMVLLFLRLIATVAVRSNIRSMGRADINRDQNFMRSGLEDLF